VIPEVVKLTAGQSIKTADRSIARGRRVEIEVNDPGGHLDRNEVKDSGVHLMVGVWGANRTFHPASIASKGRQGRTYSVVIPFDKPVRLEVTGRKLDVEDDKGRLKQADDGPEALTEARSADRGAKKVRVQVRGVKP
jgi:hypothetical protein